MDELVADQPGPAPHAVASDALVLTPEQARVLGSLIEKQSTVPDTYPMTLNGLRTACNQRNSREPITDYDEHLILRTCDALKAMGLVRFVYPSHGARNTKYRQVLDEKLQLEPDETALISVLLLRGPQTVNELRVRTERQHPFDDNDQVEESLGRLAARPTPLVVQLGRQAGQSQARWMHLLTGPVDESALVDADGASPPASRTRSSGDPADASRVDALEARVAALEAAFGSVLRELGMAPSAFANAAPTAETGDDDE